MADGVRDTTLAETSREVASEGQTMGDLIKWLAERDEKARRERADEDRRRDEQFRTV